ncbi:hypothetical protein B0T20DRAFT_420017 [Sordaria brevicollis]|uniref:Uncharacterized protein n=1 Tax=Sordaria brevicollis TaxID=83679 RepID=A0AAE0U9X0_SORBR|nr:hypothetical protein B0T20DRAFT_420017 [Sordaria brevicollis]
MKEGRKDGGRDRRRKRNHLMGLSVSCLSLHFIPIYTISARGGCKAKGNSVFCSFIWFSLVTLQDIPHMFFPACIIGHRWIHVCMLTGVGICGRVDIVGIVTCL